MHRSHWRTSSAAWSTLCPAMLFAVVAAVLLRAETGEPTAPTPHSKAATRSFVLRVVGPDAKPVHNAKIELRSTPGIQAEQVLVGKYQRRARFGSSITSGANGRIAFERPAGWKYLDLFIEIPGYAPYCAGWDFYDKSEPIPSELTAKLESGWSVGGVVVDSDGKPVVGAQVWPLIEFTKGPGARQLLTGAHVLTNSDGKWIYQSVPASVKEVPVEISKHEFMTTRTALPRARFAIERGQLPAERIVLMPGLVVTGRVTDETGKPIEDAVVRTKFVNNVRKAVTGPDGAYRFTGAEPCEARIVASAKGRATEMKQAAIGRETKVDFVMQPGRTIRVRVLDEKGHPIPRARIFFQSWRGRFQYFEFESVSQYANGQGVWEWNEAPVDMFAADICRPDGMQLSRQPLIARKEEYVFRVPPPLVISGKVVDAETKQPIKAFRVVPGSRDVQTANWNMYEGFTSIDGRYRVRETNGQPAYILRIEAEGYWAAESRPIKSDEGNVSIDFALVRGKDVGGTVLTPAGSPARGAKVALALAGRQVRIDNGEIDKGQTQCELRETDGSGRFHFSVATDTFWLVITHSSGFIQTKCAPDAYPKVVKLIPWARVEGTFRVARRPRANAKVNIMWGDRHRFDPSQPRILREYAQPTDAMGRFVFERVAPGPAQVGNSFRMNGDDSTRMDSGQTVGVDLLPGHTTRIDLGSFGRPVIGQLRTSDGEKKPPWHFSAVWINPDDPKLHWKGPNGCASVNRDGNFCFDDVAPGDYVLIARINSRGDHLERHNIKVPAINEKLSQRPVDLGILTLEPPEGRGR